jgi:long-chain acyl-CoA synthetase
VKFCLASGAPLSPHFQNEMMSRLGVPVLAGYGLSECSPLAAVQQPMRRAHQSSVGLPLPGLDVRIFDNAGKALAHGEVGEVAFGGDAVMRGYLNRSEATKEVLRDGWLMTGDVGYLDAEGYLYVVDRKKDLILKAGFNVYPREVEDFINAHPKVDECAVIGVPDKYNGEEVKAFIVLRQGQHSSKDEIVQYCRERMAAYKCPKHIEFCGMLPRGATGKVLKRVLREKKPGGAMPSATPPSHGSTAPPTPVANSKAEATNNQDVKKPVESNSQGDAKPLAPATPVLEQPQNSSLSFLSASKDLQ